MTSQFVTLVVFIVHLNVCSAKSCGVEVNVWSVDRHVHS